jgi:hypothetical protein
VACSPVRGAGAIAVRAPAALPAAGRRRCRRRRGAGFCRLPLRRRVCRAARINRVPPAVAGLRPGGSGVCWHPHQAGLASFSDEPGSLVGAILAADGQERMVTTQNAPAANPPGTSTATPASAAPVPAPPSWPWRRGALILAGAAQLITISALTNPARRAASCRAAWSGRASACAAGVRSAAGGVHCPRAAGGAGTASGSRRPGGRLPAAAARFAVRQGSGAAARVRALRARRWWKARSARPRGLGACAVWPRRRPGIWPGLPGWRGVAGHST